MLLALPAVAQPTAIKKILYVSMVLEGPGPNGRLDARTIDEAFKRSGLFDKRISDIALPGFQELWNYDFYVQGRVIGSGISDDKVELSVYELFPETKFKKLIECSREYGYIVSESSDVQAWIENVLRDIQSLKSQGKMREYVYVKHSVSPEKGSLKETLDQLPARLNKDPSLMLISYFLPGEKTNYGFVKTTMNNDMTKISVSVKKADSDHVTRRTVVCTEDENEVTNKVYKIIMTDFNR